jgi:hypothetical protein
VGLRPSAVVRLEGALAHEVLLLHGIGGAHPPVGECARGERYGRRLPNSDDPGSWSLRSEGRSPTCTAVLRGWRRRPDPSTDSSQHNRGNAAVEERAHPDHPWSTRRTRSGRRHAVTDAPGYTPRALPGCGRGC